MKKENIDFVVCPICGEHKSSLPIHMFYKHNVDMKVAREKYPHIKVWQIDKRNKQKIKCPMCNKVFKTQTGLSTHISYIHNNLIRGTAEKNNRNHNKEGIKCPICNKVFINFSQHIELTHKIKWNKFIKKYGNYPQRYISEEYRKNLSKNKKEFYKSERGLKLKQIQREKYSGLNNWACRKEIREKISKSKLKENIIDSLTFGYGTFIRFKNGLFCRSYEEYKVLKALQDNNIEFEYEKVRLVYNYKNRKHVYITDFKVNNLIFEIKSYSSINIIEENYKDKDKYLIIKRELKKLGYNFKLLNSVLFSKELNVNIITDKELNNKLLEDLESNKIESIRLILKPNQKSRLEKDIRFKKYSNLITIKRYNKLEVNNDKMD